MPLHGIATPPQPKLQPSTSSISDESAAEVASVNTIMAVVAAITTLVGWSSSSSDARVALAASSKLTERNNHLGRCYMFDLTTLAETEGSSVAIEVKVRAELAALIVAATASLRLHDGILAATLVLIERMLRRGIQLDLYTARPLVLTALLLASKEGFDDVRRTPIYTYTHPVDR